MKCITVLFVVFATVAADGNWGPENKWLCGHCKDELKCDKSTGKCQDGCAGGWNGDLCDQPSCDAIDCGADGKCVNPGQCVCGYLYANSEDGGCYSLRADGIKGFFAALLILICAITICGCTQHQLSKKSKSE